MRLERLRVESGLAQVADQGALGALSSDHWGQCDQVHVLGSAWQPTVAARVPVVLQQELDAQRLLGRVGVVGQDAGAQHLEAVPPAGLDDVLGQAVQGLGVGIGVRVVEDRQNLRAPVPHGRQQLPELGLYAGRNRDGEVVEGLDGLGLGQVEEAVERLLGPVGGGNLRLVVQPHIQVETLLLGQVGRSLLEHDLGPDPVPAHLDLLDLAETDAHLVHGFAGHAQDVELVHHHHGVRQQLGGNPLIRPPHVDGDHLDDAAVPEVPQPGRQGVLVPGRKHVQQLATLHVRQHQAHLAGNLRLVDTQNPGQLGSVAGRQGLHALRSHGTDGLLVHPDLLGHQGKGVNQGLAGDEVRAPLGHPALVQHPAQRLKECLPAVPAPVAAHRGFQLRRLVARRAVGIRGLLGAVPIQTQAPALGARPGLVDVLRNEGLHRVFDPAGGQFPAFHVQNVSHPRIVVWKSHKTVPRAATVAEQHSIGIVEVGLVQRHAVGVQKGVRVAFPDGAVEADGCGPVLGLVVPDVAPLLLGVVGAHPAGRARRLRPTHPLDQQLALLPVHALGDEWVEVPPLLRALADALHLVRADAQAHRCVRDALSGCPAPHDALLPLVGAVTGQLSDLPAQVGEYRHQKRFAVRAAVQVHRRPVLRANPMQLHAHLRHFGAQHFVHVLPGGGLLSTRVGYDREVGTVDALLDESRHRSRLDPSATRPNLSSLHQLLPHEIPFQHDKSYSCFQHVIPVTPKKPRAVRPGAKALSHQESLTGTAKRWGQRQR